MKANKEQITLLELLPPFLREKHPNQTLVIIDNELLPIELQDSLSDSLNPNHLFKDIQGFNGFEDLDAFNGLVSIFVVEDPSVIREMLRIAYDNKWGFGSYFFVWQNNDLIWGRD